MHPPAVVPLDAQRLRGLCLRHRSRQESLQLAHRGSQRVPAAALIHQEVSRSSTATPII